MDIDMMKRLTSIANPEVSNTYCLTAWPHVLSAVFHAQVLWFLAAQFATDFEKSLHLILFSSLLKGMLLSTFKGYIYIYICVCCNLCISIYSTQFVQEAKEGMRQGRLESGFRDMMVMFSSREFSPVALENAFVNTSTSVHIWQGSEDYYAPVTLPGASLGFTTISFWGKVIFCLVFLVTMMMVSGTFFWMTQNWHLQNRTNGFCS
jgi:hypothetical protein